MHPSNKKPCWLPSSFSSVPGNFCIFHEPKRRATKLSLQFWQSLETYVRTCGNSIDMSGFSFPALPSTRRIEIDISRRSSLCFDASEFWVTRWPFRGNCDAASFADCTFNTEIKFSDDFSPDEWNFHGSVFEKSVQLQAFGKKLSCTNTKFSGSLLLRSVRKSQEQTTLDFSGARFEAPGESVDIEVAGGPITILFSPEAVNSPVQFLGNLDNSKLVLNCTFNGTVRIGAKLGKSRIESKGCTFRSEVHVINSGDDRAHHLDFSECTFSRLTRFHIKTRWMSIANSLFQDHQTTFSGGCDRFLAMDAKFCSKVSYRGFQFGEFWFTNAEFVGEAIFKDAQFLVDGAFDECTFLDSADFSTREKDDRTGAVSFQGAIFHGDVDFKTRTFTTTTDFTRVTFYKAPKFFDCRIHRDTEFPPPKNFKDRSGPQAAARYRHLRLSMEEIRHRRTEGWFFELEQRCIRFDEQASRSEKFVSLAYGFLSRYGQSFVRPIAGVGVTLIASMVIYILASPDVRLIWMAAIDWGQIKNAATYAGGQLFAPFFVWRDNEFGLVLKLLGSLISLIHAMLIGMFLVALRWHIRRG